jgi:hypothetical protein
MAANDLHRNDRISFRENDRDAVGGLIDDVRLIPT